ncbi:MAG: peroxidase [Opitutales bacterium]|nr:peroxidase [Opitutales bacterium]
MKDLPSDANLGHVFQRFPKGVDHLLKYHDAVLRGPSEFTIGERELIAAYVSSLNSCYYCAGVHSVIAETFGIEVETFQTLIENPGTDTFGSKLSPILNYLRKLTLNPSKMLHEDAEAVRTVGWSEDALFEAISVCALFSFMHRIVEGSGLNTSTEARTATRERHRNGKSDTPYTDFGKRLGIIDLRAKRNRSPLESTAITYAFPSHPDSEASLRRLALAN